MTPLDIIPRIPVGEVIESGLDWIKDTFEPVLEVIRTIGNSLVDGFTELLLAPPELVLVLIFALLAWLVRSWKLALGTGVSFLFIMSMDQWDHAMETLALVVISTLIALVIAIPLGIWAAKSPVVSAIVRPVLDFMQTMPAMVYLIPAVFFFSLGAVPGMFATIIFSLPPGVRLTELGIRQVDSETVEAGQSFGATEWEILRGIQIPLAIPSIMAGINQVIMLALSMVVIAGMVGADGLGKEVVSALSTVNIAKGVEAGLAIVILAIFLDRFTAALGAIGQQKSSLIAMYRTWSAQRGATHETNAETVSA
ncbi:MAG: ABC transporter permease [Arachnia sp.]